MNAPQHARFYSDARAVSIHGLGFLPRAHSTYPRACIALPEFATVLTLGVLLGIAAEVLLGYFGVDVAGTWTGLRHASASITRLGFSWWALWVTAYAAFAIGRYGADWARRPRNRRRGLVAGVPALVLISCLGHLPQAPCDLGAGTVVLLRIMGPLACAALALWGLGLARRHSSQSCLDALREPIMLSATPAVRAVGVRPVRARVIPRELDRDPALEAAGRGTEFLEQLASVEFRTLGL